MSDPARSLDRQGTLVECPACGDAVTRRSIRADHVPKALLEELADYFEFELLPAEVYDRILGALS